MSNSLAAVHPELIVEWSDRISVFAFGIYH